MPTKSTAKKTIKKSVRRAAKQATKGTKAASKRGTSRSRTPTSRPARRDVIAVLKADHHEVEQLFRSFEKAGDHAYAEKRACRVDPFTPIGRVDAEQRTALAETAARLLRANLGPGRRVTYAGGYAVYRRSRRPCPRCGTIVRMRRQGEHARSAYWCPKCQPPVPPDSSAAD